ncbi:hypothetical protein DFH11DRAFT_317937 [Phellopilus nigrolimitatus]|nr:hypothetical protein DFH11DRAFT_317937 [Phellopilus nigrolimitatus]
MLCFLQCVLEDVHLVDGYIIGALQHHRDKSIIAISLSSIRNILPSASDSRVAQILTLERDIPYASCLVPRIPTMSCSDARLSICTFHWKSEAERKRKGISITMSMDMFNQEASRYFSVLDSFILTTTAGTVSPNANLPSITHLERPGTMILDSQIRKDSQVSRPSQAGSVMIKFSDLPFVEHPQEEAWMLATVSCAGDVTYRTLNMPHTIRAKLEFCSGTLYFSTEESVVIQYFD